MKHILTILMLAVLGTAAFGQKQYKSFTNDTVQGNTLTYASNVKVTKYANSYVGFIFTHTDVTDSLSVAKLQGSFDNSTFVDCDDETASLSLTTTDGTSILYLTSPKYLYYRAVLTAATGDEVAITNAVFIIKED